MNLLQKLTRNRSLHVVVGILLSAVWAYFALIHVRAYSATGEFAYLIFCVSETLQAVFFIFRTMPKAVSTDPFSWLVAGGGTFVVFFLQPTGVAIWQHGNILIMIAVAVQIVALLSLNRSFAIVAAEREIKTSGLYRFVRHPMYMSYILLFSGYLLFNTSLFNALLIALNWAFMFLRITEEEKLLSESARYREYKTHVKWRLIPFVY